jgi:hypothetical protein
MWKCAEMPGEEAQADQGEGARQQPDHALNSHPFGFPLSLVKRVMCMDPEVLRVSGTPIIAWQTAEHQVPSLAMASITIC